MAATRSKAQIEAEIAAARARLAGNVEALIIDVHPQAIKTRAVNDAKDFVAQEVNGVRSLFVDASGAPKWDKIAYLAAAVVGSIAALAVTKSIFRR